MTLKSTYKKAFLILEVQNLQKKIKNLEILKNINIFLREGEIVALVGPSGAGKTTVLQICALLDRPTKGDIRISGQKTAHLSEQKRTLIRRNTIGFVYQFHHLLPDFSAVENVMLPMLVSGASWAGAQERSQRILQDLQLSARLLHKPSELSGGEKQRVAIARSLANDPQILLADEPTGNLDSHTSQQVFDLLIQNVRQKNMCALIATHNDDLARAMDRIITIQDGQIHEA